jgi:NAD(P)-dependent dehydrogenase (short-subunit alcohol dehydrogenase family)
MAQASPRQGKAYIITGPTSDIGYRTALQLARHGTVILVGRDREKLGKVSESIERAGGHAIPVVCDLSDVASVRRAAAEITALGLPIASLVNNAGTGQTRATKNARCWDTVFATNHLSPFVLTEALAPRLPDGLGVVFVCSAVEDPERRPAKIAGFRRGRCISTEASARGEGERGGSALPDGDASDTSKQCELATRLPQSRSGLGSEGRCKARPGRLSLVRGGDPAGYTKWRPSGGCDTYGA